MDRYALIHTKMPREFVLLQGSGCRWGRCTFCNYHKDVSDSPYELNKSVLLNVTGVYGVLDVINSGSVMEMDERTLDLIAKVVCEKNIHTLWFEAHYMYRNRLKEFAKRFPSAEVKFRCGIESFDSALRSLWNKGIPSTVTPQEIAHYFSGVCLLCCTTDDSKARILSDIATAQKYFEYFSVNLFCDNGTDVKRDNMLAKWFTDEVYPMLKDADGVEVLLENTDLGVG